jgi:hypothetical protein
VSLVANQQPWPLQAFVLGKDIFDALSFEEIDATYKDMEEMGIAKLPYEIVDVLLPVSAVLRIVKHDGSSEMVKEEPGTQLRLRMTDVDYQWLYTRHGTTVDLVQFIHDYMLTQGFNDADQLQSTVMAAVGVRRVLIVLLATKNIVKETKECKLLKYGIGSKERNRYTTTIKIGRVTEHEGTSRGAGVERRPHLRRGHVRRQHHGPNNELVKSIFIQPVFVNADKGWISERTAYNVSGRQHA